MMLTQETTELVQTVPAGKELEQLIEQAIKKVGCKREKDLCHYLPAVAGGYIHHFTLKKMKLRTPAQLHKMLDQFILTAEKPTIVAPKKRAPRGSRKKKDNLVFSEIDVEKIRALARSAGDKELLKKLTPIKELAALKKELIRSIRAGVVKQSLWDAFVESIN